MEAVGGDVAAAAVTIISDLAQKSGLEIDADTIIRLAGELIRGGVEILDEHAKKKAAAAGDAAAAAITTEDAAEAAQRKP